MRGLTIDDFEILDRGERRPLLRFEVIDVESVGRPEMPAEVPTIAQRHFLLVFDLAYSWTRGLKNLISGSRELTKLVEVAVASACSRLLCSLLDFSNAFPPIPQRGLMTEPRVSAKRATLG